MRRLLLSNVALLVACSAADSAPRTDRAPATSVQPAAPARVAQKPHTLVGNNATGGVVSRVRIATRVGDAPATDRPAYARADEPVTLFAVLEAAGVVYSDAPSLVLGGKRVTPTPLAQAPAVSLAWQRVEPASANYSNGDPSTFHFHAIEYRTTAIARSDNLSSLRADVRPTLTPDYGGGVGTMRYRLVVRQDDREVASPGPEARRGKGSGGLTDAVTRVSVRTDDSYLGYLTEMFGQPYIWGSAGTSTKTHQSERLEGSDCADFIVYGARRMGADIPYMWTGELPTVTRKLGGGTRSADGVYRDAKGKPVAYTVAGDLVLFPRHVGVLVEDRGQLGILDDQDLMMHTLFDSPKRQAIADSGYADTPVEVRRFLTPRSAARMPASRSSVR
jgi:hypothetical protein